MRHFISPWHCVARTLLRWAAATITACTLAASAQAQVLVMPDSTNNRLVSFSGVDGRLLNAELFALAGGTPLHALSVGNEIWVSEQLGDRVSRWSLEGSLLGQIGGGTSGGLDNVRGMGWVGGNVSLTLPSFNVVHNHSVTRLSLTGPCASLLRTSLG